ncbi:MAG: hypothetical protein L0Y50_13955, partial [Beijerinckiaceae bacterium]|nr:hypothetical protein [Beijerinckiaceae bacterium]
AAAHDGEQLTARHLLEIRPHEERRLDHPDEDIGETPDGFRITPYDPELEAQIKAAKGVMKKRRNALRELAE